MSWITPGLEMIIRLGLASVVGFLVGLDRESTGHPAGERTHALVALGAATFAMISDRAFPGSDPARVAAGVVTGIGFLGAGMIVNQNPDRVSGLTTAAGIWAVGGIGLSIGAGLYWLGISSAGFVLLILLSKRILRPCKRNDKKQSRREKKDQVRAQSQPQDETTSLD